MRWENGIAVRPICKGTETSFLSTRKIWKCKNKSCKKQFSAKVGTILEGSNIGLDKWICGIWLITNAKTVFRLMRFTVCVSQFDLARLAQSNVQ
jgi:hypothetical protein